jgi:signal transduction histidine kinase
MGEAQQPATARAPRGSAPGQGPPSYIGLDRRAGTGDRREAAFSRKEVVVAGAAGSARRRWPAVAIKTKRAFAITVGLLSAGVIGLELVRPLHIADLGARAAMESALALSALVSAFLLASRLNRTWRRRDLLLLAALATVALTDFAFAGLPLLGVVNPVGPENSGWLVCTLVGAVALAAVGLAPDRRMSSNRRRALAIVAIAAVGVVVSAELFNLLSGGSRTSSAVQQVVALISSGVLVLAGIAFVQRIGRAEADGWLMAGVCFLLAGDVLLQHLAASAGAADWVTPGDGLRIAAYGMLLVVAVGRYSRTAHETARAALNDERERIAGDLHDGLAQDLTCIGIQAQALESQLGSDHPLIIAARSALAVSRSMIVDLAARSAPTTAAALRLVAAELELRFDVQVHVVVVADTGGGPREPAPAEREQLVRIAREAINNAVQHGRARHVDVVLDYGGSDRLLLVSDDGCGITESALKSGNGFGLPTMQARAESLGGRLQTRRGADGGTRLEVLVPRGGRRAPVGCRG